MQSTFNLQNIIHGDAQQVGELFHAAATPSPASTLRISTAEKVCGYLLKDDQFDSALAAHIHKIQSSIALQIGQDDTFYCAPDHLLRNIINLIITRGRTWYARDSKSSQQFMEKLALLTQIFSSANLEQIQTNYNEFQNWLDAEDKRAAMLETRLCETEINSFKILTAECKVLDLINANIAQKPFPIELHSELVSILKSELLHSSLTLGADNPFWKLWQRLLPVLSQVFKSIAAETLSDEETQRLYHTVPALLIELERSLEIHTSHPDSYRKWVENLSTQLMLTIKKQPIHCELFSALNYPEGFNNLKARVTNDLLQQTNNIQQGDWILFSGENDTTIRCKLALKNTETHQFLFVDNNGRKVMNKSVQDFAVCLSTGIAKKITLHNIENVIERTIQALIDLQQQKKLQLQANAAKLAEAAELQRQAELDRKQQIEAEEKQRIVEELNARKAAAQKALAEAAAIAEERALRAAELALQQERERLNIEAAQNAENLQRIQLANINISALNLGARVEIIQNGEPVRCKLAVIIAATGKYIFSDNIGRKVAEFQREQLVQALLNNQLTLLNNGDSFDDQLVKVIRGLRKDIS
ncbi:MAG: DUF1631 family protein [Gammaproteobacteria bacterium]|nr:MAG: DUF1631 family protein [Gammaproteobacteria bacterium]